MSRQVRSLIIALICVVLLGGGCAAVYFLTAEPDDPTSATSVVDTSVVLLNKKADTDGKTVSAPVKQLEISQADGSFRLSPNDEGQLRVEDFADLLIHTSNINSLVNQVSSVTATRRIADDSAKAADFGLETPQVIATVTYHDDTTATLVLGNLSPLSDGYYFKISGDDAIYLVPTTVGTRLLQPKTTYIGTNLITPPAIKEDDQNGQVLMSALSLSGLGRETPFAMRLCLDSDREELQSYAYITTSPSVQGVNDDSIADILGAATSLNATGAVKAYPTDDDLSTYGLAYPFSQAELTLAVQTTEPSENGQEAVTSLYNAQQHTIRLGHQLEDGSYYAMVDTIPVVYTVSAAAVPWAETELTDIINTMLYQVNITKVSRLAVTAGGETHTFDLTHDESQEDSDKKLTVTSGDKTYATADFRRLYQVFMWIQRYGETAEKPTGDPELTVTMTYDGGQFSASFYKLSTSLYLCQRNGGETYTVRAVRVKEALTQLANYLNGDEVSVNYAL